MNPRQSHVNKYCRGKLAMQTLVPTELQFLISVKDMMTHNFVMHHRFLKDFENNYLSKEQLIRFAIQWYKTARAHKEAFPVLIYNTPDDEVRFDLIEILNEEYGGGDREKIHAKLLRRFLTALSISEKNVEDSKTLGSVRNFGEEVLKIWKEGNPVYAFGLHFALEFLASSLHAHFADGLKKYDFLTDYDKAYFNYHKTAEPQHADFSENGMVLYATNQENQALLYEGVEKGIELLMQLWDEFYSFVFQPGLASAPV
jgi:pyrroloquinoline quinone (PQQ) biosynthesis protein C